VYLIEFCSAELGLLLMLTFLLYFIYFVRTCVKISIHYDNSIDLVEDSIMKAQIIEAFGDANVFKLTDIPKPKLIPGHVIIRVLATSVNPIDCKIRSGAVTEMTGDFPVILHGDVAGVVEAAADDVTTIAVGDEVYGCAGGVRGCAGALAEFMLADARLLAKKPRSLSMQDAAALPLVSLTACEALFNKARLTNNQTILIHGGIGGVGHIAVQLAKSAGAKVATTVIRQEDFSLAKSFGADEIINAKEENVESYVQRITQGLGFDIVFDTVGGPNLDRSFLAAAPNGIVVSTALRSAHDLKSVHNKGLSLHSIFILYPLLTNVGREKYGNTLTEIAALVDAGKLKSWVDSKSFTLETVNEAHAYLESGYAKGKVILVIN
jgi:NADPH2:quinone reductase